MKELPKKLKLHSQEGMNEMVLQSWYKINEILDYLESQKEGEDYGCVCDGDTLCVWHQRKAKEEPKQQCEYVDDDGFMCLLNKPCPDHGPKHTDGICQACRQKEEPKQVDVLRMIVPEDVELSIPEGCKIYGSILNKTGKPIQVIIKQALQQ